MLLRPVFKNTPAYQAMWAKESGLKSVVFLRFQV